MVVALGAAGRQAEKSPRCGVHSIILKLRAEAIKTEARHQLFALRGGEKIARDLSLDEQIVRHVVIECGDHPIPIAEAVRVRIILGRIQPVVGIAGDVQPETAPPLAITRRSEQPVDNLSGGIGRAIAHKGVYIFGIGGQTGQIKRGAPDPCAPVGCRRRREPFAFETRQHERVDRRLHPGVVLYFRHRRLAQRLERPVGPLLGSDHIPRSAFGGLNGGLVLRPDRASTHPLSQNFYLLVFQLPRRRHLEPRVGVGNGLNQKTVGGLGGYDCRTRIATFENVFARGQIETTQVSGGMTGITVLGQQRPDAHLEKLGSIGRRRAKRAEPKNEDKS